MGDVSQVCFSSRYLPFQEADSQPGHCCTQGCWDSGMSLGPLEGLVAF